MNGDIKVLYGGKDIFSGICPSPFVFFDKEYIEYDENGNIHYKYYYIDGKRNGAYIEYDKNGNIDFTCYFIDGYKI